MMRIKLLLAALSLPLAGFAVPSYQPSASYPRLLEINEELKELEQPFRLELFDALSLSALDSRHSRIRALLDELRQLAQQRWSDSERIDYLLLRVRANELDFDSRRMKPWSRDPGFYIDLIRAVPYVETPVAGDESATLKTKLKAVPSLLSQARTNLLESSAELARLAIFHLENYDGVGQGQPLREDPPAGVVGWYQDLVARLQNQPSLLPEAQLALSAVASYRDWLRDNISGMTSPAWIGLGDFNWFLKNVRLMPFQVEDLRVVGEVEIARAWTLLEIERNRNRDLPELEPAARQNDYEAGVREAENRIRKLVRERGLLTIPDDVGPMETDAFWRFGMKRHFWEELQYRDPHNNHIHASIPGHRFDVLMARRNISNPIRAVARDGGRIEGWAFYVEEMLLQAGLLDDRPRARELFYIAQLARAIRIPAELAMQSGEKDLAQAIEYMVAEVPFMEENLARYDLEIYFRRPAYGMNYIMGKLQIERLLADRRLRQGNAFQLGRFHDEFLSHGLIPVSLIRAELLGWDENMRNLWEEVAQ